MGKIVPLTEFKEREVQHIDGPEFENEMLLIKENEGYLTTQGYLEIRDLIWHNYGVRIPDREEWKKWMHTEGDYKGSLPKRIGKLVREVSGEKVDAQTLSEIGNLARGHTMEAEVLYLDFKRKIDWRDGDFGDNGSCYWGCNAGAKEMIENAGGCAVRYWKKYDGIEWSERCCYGPNGEFYIGTSDDLKRKHGAGTYAYMQSKLRQEYEGVARAWLLPYGPDWVVFNAYGIVETREVARTLAMLFGTAYHRIDIANHGRTGGELYINSGRGYLLTKDPSPPDYINFEIEEVHGSGYFCETCGENIYEDDVYHAGDYVYCEYCFFEYYDWCCRCGEAVYREEMCLDVNGEMYCPYCFDQTCFRCENCGEGYPHENRYEVEGDVLCLTCFEENCAYCEECEEWYYLNSMWEGLCQACYDEKGEDNGTD
jgi:hypothetical protein